MRKLTIIAFSVAMSLYSVAGLRLPDLNIDSLQAEDDARNSHKVATMFRSSAERATLAPFRVAVSTETEISLLDYAERTVAPSGKEILTYDVDAGNAMNISLFFSKFHLLPGDTLFIVGVDGVFLGPYTSADNHESGVLPTAMIDGAKAQVSLVTNGRSSSSRELTLGRVNQGYKDFRRLPYQNSSTSDACSDYGMGDLEAMSQAVGLVLYASGSSVYSCSGVLMNNAAGHTRPYFLTAGHCLSSNEEANTAVIYFNYASPLGNSDIRGSMETYSVVPYLRAVSSDLDFSLSELSSMPERDARVYYAGWSLTTNPYVPAYAIHHPSGTVKRLAKTVNTLSTATFKDSSTGSSLYPDGHWLVSRWKIGTTEGGSSGAPLFDYYHRVIGVLSGGSSTCAVPTNDLFVKLNLAWNTYSESGKQLKAWLDPDNTSLTVLDGVNPYGADSCRRMTNLTAEDAFTNTFSAPAGASMVAQAFSSESEGYLYGVYVVASTNYLPNEIYIYNDLDAAPIYTHSVSTPNTAEWIVSSGYFKYAAKTGIKNADTYIRFDNPVPVGNNFYVAYSTSGQFVPYAAQTAAPSAVAYAKVNDEWKTLTDAGSAQNVVWIDAVVSPNSSRVSTNEAMVKKASLSISPNPVSRKSGNVKLSAGEEPLGKCQIEVYDLNLRKLISLHAYSETSEIDVNVSSLQTGVYVLKVISENSAFVGKLVVAE